MYSCVRVSTSVYVCVCKEDVHERKEKSKEKRKKEKKREMKREKRNLFIQINTQTEE